MVSVKKYPWILLALVLLSFFIFLKNERLFLQEAVTEQSGLSDVQHMSPEVGTLTEDGAGATGLGTKRDDLSPNISSITRMNQHPRACALSSQGPLPVILFALGRSGSSITWNTISALTKEKDANITTAWEYTGGNPRKSKEFFENLEKGKEGYDWAVKHLCNLQRKSLPGQGIIGFQWKPFPQTLKHTYAVKGLEQIALQSDPNIHVVYLTRNPIDVMISNFCHKESKNNQTVGNRLEAHCNVGDEECLKQFALSEKRGVEFPVGSELIKMLERMARDPPKNVKRLTDLNFKFIHVTYENLYNTDDAKEWMRIFEFLDVGPSKNLTIEDV